MHSTCQTLICTGRKKFTLLNRFENNAQQTPYYLARQTRTEQTSRDPFKTEYELEGMKRWKEKNRRMQ